MTSCCSNVEFTNTNFMRQYFVGSIFQLLSLSAAFGISYRYFGHLPLFIPFAYLLNSLLGMRAIGFKSERAILIYVFTTSFLFSLPITFLFKYLAETFVHAQSVELGLAHLISVLLDSFGTVETPLSCKYFLLAFTVFTFTFCFSIQIFLLIIAKRVRLQILAASAVSETPSSPVDEIELQDYKTPQYAQPQTHNGYMPVSREVPVYVDAQGNMVHY